MAVPAVRVRVTLTRALRAPLDPCWEFGGHPPGWATEEEEDLQEPCSRRGLALTQHSFRVYGKYSKVNIIFQIKIYDSVDIFRRNPSYSLSKVIISLSLTEYVTEQIPAAPERPS